MKFMSNRSVVLTGITISLIHTILTSFYLGGLDFFNRIMPVIIISMSAYYSHVLSQAVIDYKEAQRKYLAAKLAASEAALNQQKLKQKRKE